MATKTETITHYIDDLDGSKAEGTVSFAFDGKNYEIDLNRKNRTAFEKALAPYLESARAVRAPRARATTRRASGSEKERLQAIREWAKTQGLKVAERGRISQEVLDQYDAAH